jgi:hypothetical protein
MSMRVIFLDIDGVLVNRTSWARRQNEHASADPNCVAALNRILEKSSASIVVSSSWRCGRYPSVMLKKMKEVLNDFGVKGRMLGVTPTLDHIEAGHAYITVTRGQEIMAWLTIRSRSHTDIVEFVILDDDSDMGELAPRHIKTEFDLGLTETDADRALKLFGL